MSESRELTVSKIEPLLTQRELFAYNVWRNSNRAALAPSLNAKLYALFLQGKDCEAIRRLNEQLTLGDVVAARIEGKWDERRSDYLDQLLSDTTTRVQQTTLETADLICDVLTVARLEFGDRLQRYIQTRDEKELEKLGFKIEGLQGLQRAIDMLQALTGQSRRTEVQHTGEVKVEVPPPKAVQPTAQEAAEMLKGLLAAKSSK